MGRIEYSVEAEEAKRLFYNKDYTVFVEGADDVIFWSKLFELAELDSHIEDVGGKDRLKTKIYDILDSGASFIVCCDSDHSDFDDERIEHQQIIRTYGYSIENSMYCNYSKSQITRKYNHTWNG